MQEYLCFDDFRIDLNRKLLFKQGHVVPVQSRVFDLIAHLAAHAGSVCTKDDILDAVWSSANISEGNLVQHVLLARRVLGDAGKVARYISTVHGRGYRFDAKVQAVSSETPSAEIRGDEVDRLTAVQLVTNGRYFARLQTSVGLQSSIELYTRALELQPRYATPYAAIATSYLHLGDQLFVEPSWAFEKACGFALRALEFGDSSPEAREVLAGVSLFAERDVRGCRHWLDEIERRFGYSERSAVLRVQSEWAAGRGEHSLTVAREALERDPQSTVINAHVGAALLHAKRTSEAIQHLQNAVALAPSTPFARFMLGIGFLVVGDVQNAVRHLRWIADVERISLDAPHTNLREHAIAVLGYIDARFSNGEFARSLQDDFARPHRNRYISATSRAIVAFGLGERDDAYAFLRAALADRDPWIVFLPVMPYFHNALEDATFQAIMQEVRRPNALHPCSESIPA